MSNYITKQDYITNIRDARLDEIIDLDDTLLDLAEVAAEAQVRDLLYQRYDTGIIFSKTGDARHMQVVEWMKHIVLYKIYERIDDELLPDRIVKNYDDTMGHLEKLNEGKRTADLPRREEADGKKATKFRWGSDTMRSHG